MLFHLLAICCRTCILFLRQSICNNAVFTILKYSYELFFMQFLFIHAFSLFKAKNIEWRKTTKHWWKRKCGSRCSKFLSTLENAAALWTLVFVVVVLLIEGGRLWGAAAAPKRFLRWRWLSLFLPENPLNTEHLCSLRYRNVNDHLRRSRHFRGSLNPENSS